jgi:hypothetical protein
MHGMYNLSRNHLYAEPKRKKIVDIEEKCNRPSWNVIQLDIIIKFLLELNVTNELTNLDHT